MIFRIISYYISKNVLKSDIFVLLHIYIRDFMIYTKYEIRIRYWQKELIWEERWKIKY